MITFESSAKSGLTRRCRESFRITLSLLGLELAQGCGNRRASAGAAGTAGRRAYYILSSSVPQDHDADFGNVIHQASVIRIVRLEILLLGAKDY